MKAVGNGLPCVDGDACTEGDACNKGLCKGSATTCFCVAHADCAKYEDGDACNGTLFCEKASGTCQVNKATAVVCKSVDDTPCLRNTCAPTTGLCAMQPIRQGQPCPDGKPCGKPGVCHLGSCHAAKGACSCKVAADCKAFDDGNACNGASICKAGSCGTGPALVCDDGNPCTTDACDPKKGCTATAKVVACDDGDACTTDACDPTTGGCKNTAIAGCKVACATAADCSSGNPCLDANCDKKTGTCSFAPVTGNKVCGHGERCNAKGTCEAVTAGWARRLSGHADGQFYCALTWHGRVACWGRNHAGQVGQPTTTKLVSKPTLVAGIANVVKLAAGPEHACAVTSSGALVCWGSNKNGQAAPGSSAKIVDKPSVVTWLSNVAQVVLGQGYSCARTVAGKVACWGVGADGRLGQGDEKDRAAPAFIASLDGAVDIAGGTAHACALRVDGTTWCWGKNDSLQVRAVPGSVLAPVKLPDMPAGSVRVVAGAATTCAGRPGDWRCRGANKSGQLGIGAAGAKTAVTVASAGVVVQVSPGFGHHIALNRAGTVWGAGAGSVGQLGTGSLLPVNPSWVQPKLGATVVDVQATLDATCAIDAGGQVWCTGAGKNGGQGSGSTVDHKTPQKTVGFCVDAKMCDDGNACTKDACSANKDGCVHTALPSGPCNDGDACTVADGCTKGACSGKPKVCDDGDACTTDACDAKTGACVAKALAAYASCGGSGVCVPDLDKDKALVGHWTFDDCKAQDSSGQGHDGVVAGKPACIASPYGGKALVFDGKADHVRVPDAKTLDVIGPSLTAIARIRLDAPGAYSAAVGKDHAWMLGIDKGQSMSAVVIGKANRWWWGGRATVPQGTWMALALVIDGKTVRSYRDGQLYGIYKHAALLVDSNCPLGIGARFNGCKTPASFFKGAIDDLRLYRRVLSEAEIAAASKPVAKGCFGPAKCLTAPACNDADGCTLDACKVADGICSHAVIADETACDDGDKCTQSTVCKAGVCTWGGLEVPAKSAPVAIPGALGITLASDGFLWVTSQKTYAVYRWHPTDSKVVALAGGTAGFADGKGAAARFKVPGPLAPGPAGSVYVGDISNFRIRHVTPAGAVKTLAGGAAKPVDGTGDKAGFAYIAGLATDAAGTLWLTDRNDRRVRTVTAAGVVKTLAGSGAKGLTDGPGSTATFDEPGPVAPAAGGGVWVAERVAGAIRRVASDGTVVTVASKLTGFEAMAVDSHERLWVIPNTMTSVGRLAPTGYSPILGMGVKGALGTSLGFKTLASLWVTDAGQLWVVDSMAGQVRPFRKQALVCDDGNKCTTEFCPQLKGACIVDTIPGCK